MGTLGDGNMRTLGELQRGQGELEGSQGELQRSQGELQRSQGELVLSVSVSEKNWEVGLVPQAQRKGLKNAFGEREGPQPC